MTDSAPPADTPVLEVRDLRTYLYTRAGVTKAVDGVSVEVRAGETLGIVGESGSGKSMLALSVVGLTPKPVSRIVGGQVLVQGEDLLRKTPAEMRKVRGRQVSMILQDPHQSLNPVYTVGNQLIEALRIHDSGSSRAELRRKAVEALRMVRVPAPERRLRNHPHEMSGGMKQRVVGTMALAYRPPLLIADEPTTALDVTIQAQYLSLLRDLQRETNVAIMLITHDFSVVAAMCDRVAVMYAGRIVEQGAVADIFAKPSHPYTEALLASLPRLEERRSTLYHIEGQPPSMTNLPTGCYFNPRCQHVMEQCRESYPPNFDAGPNHVSACWRLDGDDRADPG